MSLICLVLITACGENKSKKTTFSTDDYLHVIDLNKTAPEVNFSEVFASITPIVLETTKNSLIGRIDKVIATPEYIIVLDNSIAKALFLFKKDGAFVHKFGRMGNGPGEYTNIYDFCYDKATGTIYMLCLNNRINLYDIHTGSFLKSVTLENNNGSNWKIYYNDGELYTVMGSFAHFANENGYLLNRINQTTGKVEEAWFDFETHSKNVDYNFTNPFLFGDDKSFKFKTALMDGIFSIEKGKITPFLTFPPEYIFTKDDFKALEPNTNIYHYLLPFRKVSGVSVYYERKDFIFMVFTMQMTKKLIYNKKTKEFKYVSEFEDDLMHKKRSRGRINPANKEEAITNLSSFIASDDNGLYAVHGDSQSPKNMRMLLEGDYISDYFKSAATKLANLEEDVNPFLFYYEFKD